MIDEEQTTFEKTTMIEFNGGYVKFTRQGEFQNQQGKTIQFDDSVKIMTSASAGKEVKVSGRGLKAVIKLFTTDERAIQFLSSLPKPEKVDID